MLRLTALAVLLLASAGCRASRTWHATVGMERGSTCDLWMGTSVEDLAQDSVAESCSAVVVSVDEGLSLVTHTTDAFGGQCWLGFEATLSADAPEVATVTFDFRFNICDDVGDNCPENLANSAQQKVLTVRSDVLDGSVQVPDCES